MKLNVYAAESGKLGLEILTEDKVDLIVSDMRMPEIDGATFLIEGKSAQPDALRILLTGYADIESTVKTLNKGEISRYISKPWDDEEMLATVSEVLKLKRLEREKAELSIMRRANHFDELIGSRDKVVFRAQFSDVLITVKCQRPVYSVGFLKTKSPSIKPHSY